MKEVDPRVTLVGAGPGDPELITLKGIHALEEADVVLYDALVHEDILNYAPAHVPKLYVGKRAGSHSYPQEEINQLIVENALKYGHVVRLKGGDPFVFGRGFEEIVFVESRGIPTKVIPGISSSIAVPEIQKIPFTLRGITESFCVITGTTKAGKLSNDIREAARGTATVIVLMGMSKLDEIHSIYSELGKENLPVAIIENGSLQNERVIHGTISTIRTLVKEKGFGPPAVIVIGEVISSWLQLKPVPKK